MEMCSSLKNDVGDTVEFAYWMMDPEADPQEMIELLRAGICLILRHRMKRPVVIPYAESR